MRLIIGPAARMRCKRCGQVFTVRPGCAVSHFRRQGCVGGIPCDGVLVSLYEQARRSDAMEARG